MKKALAVLIAVTILLSAFATSYGQSEFSDVRRANWAFPSIAAMSGQGILSGYPDGSFRPTVEVTYGEFIKMMVVAADGAPTKVAGNQTANEHWAAPYYERAIELEFFQADDIPRAALDQAIPRGYMALIISAALGEEVIENYDTIESNVADVNSRVKYDYHIIKSYATGILTGYPDNTFRPAGGLSRAEAAIVLHRYVDPAQRTPVTGHETVPGSATSADPNAGAGDPEANIGTEAGSGPGSGAGGELIISPANSFNPNLTWVKEGDIHEVLDQSAIDRMQALAPLEKYIIVEDASQFELEMKSGPTLTWLEMRRNKAYHEGVAPFLISEGKISEIENGRDVWGSETCTIDYEGDISTVDYIALRPAGGGVVTLIVNPF